MKSGSKERHRSKIQDMQHSIKRIKEISSSLHYRGKQRINQTALFEVEVKHTNQFTVDLGCGYSVELRAQSAIQLLNHRIKHHQDQIQKLEKLKKETEKVERSRGEQGKQKVGAIEKKNGAFMEVVGEQNGESIFNIVEVEGEDEPFQEQMIKPNNTKVEETVPKPSIQQQKQPEVPFPQENKEQDSMNEENKIDDEEYQFNEEIDNNSISYKSGEQEQEDSEEDEYDDLLLSRQARLGIHPEDGKRQMHSIPRTQAVSPPLDTIATVTDKVSHQQKNEQLPAKLSRFKMERMKERLEKQLRK